MQTEIHCVVFSKPQAYDNASLHWKFSWAMPNVKSFSDWKRVLVFNTFATVKTRPAFEFPVLSAERKHSRVSVYFDDQVIIMLLKWKDIATKKKDLKKQINVYLTKPVIFAFMCFCIFLLTRVKILCLKPCGISQMPFKINKPMLWINLRIIWKQANKLIKVSGTWK